MASSSVRVVAGALVDDSLTPSVLALVRAGAARDPSLATEIRARVVLRFADGHPPVVIDFRGEEIVVSDDDDPDRACDLEVTGRLADVLVVVSSPLAGGLPKPTHPRGRQALARLADGRVELDGPLRLGRKLVRLLQIEL